MVSLANICLLHPQAVEANLPREKDIMFYPARAKKKPVPSSSCNSIHSGTPFRNAAQRGQKKRAQIGWLAGSFKSRCYEYSSLLGAGRVFTAFLLHVFSFLFFFGRKRSQTKFPAVYWIPCPVRIYLPYAIHLCRSHLHLNHGLAQDSSGHD